MRNSQKGFLVPFLIIIFIILAGLGLYVYGGFHINTGPSHTINKNIPSDLLYQSESEKIPSKYLYGSATSGPIHTDVFYISNYEYFCKPSNKKAEHINYFAYSPGSNVYGGGYSRGAIVCPIEYFIAESGVSGQPFFYGPFKR